jgi:biopolymer transport protein ExbD
MSQEYRPRKRLSQRTNSKVPLTFYRPTDSSSDKESPFKAKQKTPHNRLKTFLISLIDIILITLLLLALIYSMFIKPIPKIMLNSEVYHSQTTYKEAARNYLGSVKNRNKITFNEESVVISMQKQFPEISSAYVELPVFAQTPVLHINVAEPSMVLRDGSKDLVVTSEGFAVGGAERFVNGKLPVVQDQSGFKASAGQQVMSSSSVKFIDGLLKQLKHSNIKISTLALPPKAQELDLRAADQPYYVKFYLGGDVLQQAGQFLAARHQFEKEAIQPAEYLDVRVPGKIYYK